MTPKSRKKYYVMQHELRTAVTIAEVELSLGLTAEAKGHLAECVVLRDALISYKKSNHDCHLQLISSLQNECDIPTDDRKGVIILAVADDVLYFRSFDGNGKSVVNTDERKLATRAQEIADLKKQLATLSHPPEITVSEKERIIVAVNAIVGPTPNKLKKVPPTTPLKHRIETAVRELERIQNTASRDAPNSL